MTFHKVLYGFLLTIYKTFQKQETLPYKIKKATENRGLIVGS